MTRIKLTDEDISITDGMNNVVDRHNLSMSTSVEISTFNEDRKKSYEWAKQLKKQILEDYEFRDNYSICKTCELPRHIGEFHSNDECVICLTNRENKELREQRTNLSNARIKDLTEMQKYKQENKELREKKDVKAVLNPLEPNGDVEIGREG